MATPNMNLELPTVSVTIGPDWANQINTALESIDIHDHSSGKGVKIPSSGLNINADVVFNDNMASSLKATKFEEQSAALTGASNTNAVHSVSGDLYFTNGSGIAIQLTSGGAIAALPGAAQTFEYVDVAANVTIGPADSFVFLSTDTTASRTITLPLANSVASGRIYIIKDKSSNSESFPISVATQGSDTIDGASSASLSSNYESWTIVGDGSGAWYIS